MITSKFRQLKRFNDIIRPLNGPTPLDCRDEAQKRTLERLLSDFKQDFGKLSEPDRTRLASAIASNGLMASALAGLQRMETKTTTSVRLVSKLFLILGDLIALPAVFNPFLWSKEVVVLLDYFAEKQPVRSFWHILMVLLFRICKNWEPRRWPLFSS